MTYEHNKRWRQRHPERRSADRARYYARRREGATRAGLPWEAYELKLLREFQGTDTELAQKLERSVQAVQQKRGKMPSVQHP